MGYLRNNIRKNYIRQFLTEDPQLIQALSQEEAFNELHKAFIIPFENNYFKITKPTALQHARNGTTLCLDYGFEKLYLQLQRSYVCWDNSYYSKDTDFLRKVNDSLCERLSWNIQIEHIKNYKNPACMLWAMTTQVHPSLYFTALGASLIRGRVDLFDALINKFDMIKSSYNKPSPDFTPNKYGRMPALNLKDIREWCFRFKCEYDEFVIPNYAKRGHCEALFELCLAKRAEKDNNHPWHLLWVLYTGNSKEILHELKNKTTLIEVTYHPHDFKESYLSSTHRSTHPNIEKMQESALSLYARNVNSQDKQIIAILLENPSVCNMIHRRNAYEETPLQIALNNKKSQLVMAMLDKTEEQTLTEHYNDEELAEINRAKNDFINQEYQETKAVRI